MSRRNRVNRRNRNPADIAHFDAFVRLHCAKDHELCKVVRMAGSPTAFIQVLREARLLDSDGNVVMDPYVLPAGQKVRLRCLRCAAGGARHDLQIAWDRLDGLLQRAGRTDTPELVYHFDQ